MTFRAALLAVAACASTPRSPEAFEVADAKCLEAIRVAQQTLASLRQCSVDADCAEVSPTVAGHCGVAANARAFEAKRALFDEAVSSCTNHVQLVPDCPRVAGACSNGLCEGVPVSVIVDDCAEAEAVVAASPDDATAKVQRQRACGNPPLLSVGDDDSAGASKPTIDQACVKSVVRAYLIRHGKSSYAGDVVMRALVNANGWASQFSFPSGGALSQASQVELANAFHECHFEPAMRDGVKVSARYELKFNFVTVAR